MYHQRIFPVRTGLPERGSILKSSRPSETLYTTWTPVISTKQVPHRLVSMYWKVNADLPQFHTTLDCTGLLYVALFHFRDTHTLTHTNVFTKICIKISVVTLANWNSYWMPVINLPTPHAKGEPAVLPHHSIRRQSEYFIYRQSVYFQKLRKFNWLRK
jgi:hypothetical protein